VTSAKIKQLLAEKHANDVFVTECKSGPTFGGLKILDAWAMKRSWTHPMAIGYEIKIHRGDFMNDVKWNNYLEYCNVFYFVTPPGTIDISELPAEAGLITVSKNGKTLYNRKKSVYRPTAIPESLYKYILMCRVDIHPSHYNKQERIEFWKNWLQRKEEYQDLGHACSRQIHKVLRDQVIKVQEENNNLKRIKEFLDYLGLNPNTALNQLQNSLKIPYEITKDIDRAIQSLNKLKQDIEVQSWK
jgi:hypothetical protein